MTRLEIKSADWAIDKDGNTLLTLTVAKQFGLAARTFVSGMGDKAYTVTLDKKRQKRGLDANAYFHVLCGELANILSISMEECKVNLVQSYGTLARDESGSAVGMKLPVSVDASTIYPYCYPYKSTCEDGKDYTCYMLFKRTSDMDSSEFAKLLDGTIFECKEQGIETDTPEQIAIYLARLDEEQKKQAV